MKRRLISLLLALAMIMSFMPMNMLIASAEEEIPAETQVTEPAESTESTEPAVPAVHEHCVCGGAVAGHEHASIQWTAWGDADAEKTKLPTAAGNYYLTSDINLTGTWYVTAKTINLCLNGHVVNGVGTKGEGDINNPNTIMMGNTADNVAETSISKLTISDCAGSGVIQSNTDMVGGVLRFRKDPYATVEIYGGELKSTVQEGTKDGGVVYMDGGTLYQYGGTLTGGDAYFVADTGKPQKNGGGVCLSNAAKFYMYGGIINGGTDYTRGAGVAVRHADAAFYMYGGTIQGGSSNYGDAIHCNNGNAYVDGGTLDVYSSNNLHKTGTGVITVKTAHFPKGMNVNTGNIADWLTEGSYVLWNGNYHAGTTGALEGNVVIGNHADHCVCGETLTGIAAQNHTCGEDAQWTALTTDHLTNGAKGGLFKEGGNYYLAGNFTTTGEVKIPNGMQVNICLNGFTWTSTSGGNASFRCVGQLSFCDCAGEGKVISNSSKQGGMVFMHPGENTNGDCTLNIYGGDFVITDNDAAGQGGLIQVGFGTNPATFNFYDGSLSGGTATRGGGVCVETSKATMNMYGGEIKDCVSVKGGAIQLQAGKLNIYDGTICGSTAPVAAEGGAIYAENKAVIVQYGGTIVGGVGDYTANKSEINGGAVGLFGSARYELHDGTVIGGTDYMRGGAVAVRDAGASFYMYGGTIQGGTANWGNAIHNNNGTVYISGGTIDSSTNGNSNLHANGGSVIIKAATFPKGIKLYSGNASLDTLKEILEEGSYIVANGENYVMGTGGSILAPSQVIAGEHTHCVCNGAVENHAHEATAWMAWTKTDSLPNANGYYYLATDVQLKGKWDFSNKNIYLCLNGHTVTGKDETEQTIMLGSAKEVEEGTVTHLAITDCGTTGKIVANSHHNGSIIRARAYGNITVDLYAGLLDANHESSIGEGGAVALYSGTFNMYGGELNGYNAAFEVIGEKTNYKYGGTVAVNKGTTFNMYGGLITGGKAIGDGGGAVGSYGGNVNINGGIFNMYGGTIADGVATIGGGNIYASSGEFNMYGGTVKDGVVSKGGRMGGNLWIGGATANLVGGTISGGKAPFGGNLRLTSGTINLSGTIVTGGIAASNGGNLSFVGGTFNMTGGKLEKGIADGGGNIFANAASGKLNLAGGEIADGTANNGGNIYFQQSADIGTVTLTGGVANARGGSIYVYKDATVKIDGATITNTDEKVTAQKGGVIYSDGTLNITGATISGGNANTSPSGGTIAIGAGEATITDSTLTAGWGSRGTCINVFNKGKLTVADSTINGRTTAGLGSTSIGTACWIEGNAEFVLVGNVQITGEGLDIIRDLRTGDGRTDVSQLAIEGDERISVRMQTAEYGQVLYAGDNAAAIDMVEPFLGTYQQLSYNAETGWIDLTLSPLVVYNAAGDPIGVDTWEEAMAQDIARVVMFGDVSGTITKSIVLDLNGYALTDMNVEEGVILSLVDSETDDCTGAYGSFSGTINGIVQEYTQHENTQHKINKYLVVNQDGAYSAHFYSVALTHVSLDANNDALGYKAEFKGDEVVSALVTEFGFHMWLDGGKIINKSVDNADKKALTLRLKGIMANNGGEMNINANAYVVFADGTDEVTADHSTNMKAVIQEINGKWSKLTAAKKEAAKAYYEAYQAIMSTWIADDVTNNFEA